MIPLTFRNYSFASLPSGTYLFFPLVAPQETTTPRLVAADDDGDPKPSRLVVSTFYGGGDCEPELLGVTEGETIYVTLGNGEFESLLDALKMNGRTLRNDPIQFDVELAADGRVREFNYDRERVRAPRNSVVVSGPATDGTTAQAARSSA